MKAYSEDVRRKVVEALECGTSKSEAACLFRVSLYSVKRYAKLAREGRALKSGKAPGKRLKIDERARWLLEANLKERPIVASGQAVEAALLVWGPLWLCPVSLCPVSHRPQPAAVDALVRSVLPVHPCAWPPPGS